MSCIDFSVSQTSSDDLVLNFCYHFFVSPSLSIPSGFFQTVLMNVCLRRSCLLTGVLEPGLDAVAVLIYSKVIFGNQAKSLTFRSGVLNGDLVFA